jgi:hypothetical protein
MFLREPIEPVWFAWSDFLQQQRYSQWNYLRWCSRRCGKRGVIDNTLSGTITLNSTSNVSTGWADKTFRMTGQITGAGGLQFDKLLYTQQPPVFQVTNTTNNYAGGTTINAGTSISPRERSRAPDC